MSKHKKHTGTPRCPLCGGRGGKMVVTVKGRRWIRCQCMKPNKEAIKAQRAMNAPKGWVQKSLLDEYEERKAASEASKRGDRKDQ